MLPCVCLVTDHRWRENVVITKKCHWCSYRILTSFLISYWTDALQHGIFLFYIITKQTTTYKAFVYFKILQHNAKAGLCPLRRTRIKAIWRDLIYTKWSNFVGCYAWQRIVIGREKSRHCQTWLERRFSWNENLQRKQNWTAKSTNLEENAGKIEPVFVIRAALWAE